MFSKFSICFSIESLWLSDSIKLCFISDWIFEVFLELPFIVFLKFCADN